MKYRCQDGVISLMPDAEADTIIITARDDTGREVVLSASRETAMKIATMLGIIEQELRKGDRPHDPNFDLL